MVNDKRYWFNLFQYFLIVGIAVFLLSVGNDEQAFDIKTGLSFVGFLAVVILGHKFAIEFSREDIKKNT